MSLNAFTMPLVMFTLCPLLCLHSTICYVYTVPLVMLALTLLLLVWVVVGGGGLGGGLGGGGGGGERKKIIYTRRV